MKNTLSPYNNTSRVKSQHSPLSNKGFTIVELLVVIVVVAILAAIAIVSYNGITRSAEETALKSNLRSAATKVTLHKSQSGSYPDGLGEVGVAEESEITQLQYSGGTNTYCVTAFSLRDPELSFYVDQSGEIREGKCDGHNSPIAAIPVTSENCFLVGSYSGGEGYIHGYLDNENGESGNPECPDQVVIPSNMGGNPIVHILQNTFADKQINSIAIPDTVERIENRAFINNNLTNLSIPDSVTHIGVAAFENNPIETLHLGSSVETIDSRAFFGNSIENVVIPDSVKTIGSSAFNKNIASLTLGSSVESIGNDAFSYNNLSSVKVPDSVVSIGQRAFAYGEITEVELGTSVESVGNYAFSGNQITSLVLPSALSTIGTQAFSNNQISSINIPDSVTSLGERAFQYNSLGAISLPSHLSSHQYYSSTPWVFQNNPNPTFTIRT